ncbi:MerR family transcriptional regulator [Kineococcus sp. SYSU DK001]|uniref:MerR family transcriptional regulator n=1 Tax=Kineococcus sp. SYSU DK001 TaxID=3383122 RepID=UPI003D7E0DFB
MRTSELARAAAIPVSTLRFYERRGVLPAPGRDPNGYRSWTEEDVRTVRFLRRGQELGFTLAELSTFSAVSAQTRATGVVAADVAEQAFAKLAEIDARIADLVRTREAIAGLLAARCLDPGAACPVVEALAG